MVGERVKVYRTLRKMSQEELADLMGFPPPTISKIEHGTRKVSLEEAVRLAESLHVSLLDLAGQPHGQPGIDDEYARHVQEAIGLLRDTKKHLEASAASKRRLLMALVGSL